ncbi:fumarylacetoacetate hydrolase family protein [Pseudochelatococcus sp. B33]
MSLYRNGKTAQHGDLDQQIWGTPEIISHLSSLFELRAGDMIVTGTPAGVGPVAVGDKLAASTEGVGPLPVNVI